MDDELGTRGQEVIGGDGRTPKRPCWRLVKTPQVPFSSFRTYL
jgi:hypothetical protein